MGHRLSPRAEADLEDIAFYVFVESGSLETADRLLESITERFALLGTHPRAGRRRDDPQRGIRAFGVGDYIVLYRVEGNDVRIQRVVHGSRDLQALIATSHKKTCGSKLRPCANA